MTVNELKWARHYFRIPDHISDTEVEEIADETIALASYRLRIAGRILLETIRQALVGGEKR